MHYLSDDPLNDAGRVIDTARRLGLELAELALVHRRPGQARLSVALADPSAPQAAVFFARLANLVDLAEEARHA